MSDSWQTIEQAAVSMRLSVRTVNRHIAAGKLPSRLTPEGRREVLVSLPDGPTAEAAGATPASTVTPPSVTRPASPLSDAPAGLQTPPGEVSSGEPAATPFDAAVSAAADAVTGTWHGSFDGASGAPVAASADASAGTTAAAAHPSAASPFSQAASPPVTVDPETVLALADNAAQKAEMAVTAYQTLARVADTQVRQVRRQARLAWAAVAVMAAGVTGAVGWTTHRLTRATGDVQYLQQEVLDQKQAARALSDKQDKMLAERLAAEDALRAELTARHEAAVAERRDAEEAARAALAKAREEAARAEGQLAAYREQEAARQTRETVAAAAAATSVPPPVLSFNALSKNDPFDTTAAPAGRSPGPVVDTSDTGGGQPAARTTPTPAEGKAAGPTTRQSAPPRRVRAATTRPAVELSDAPTRSAADAR